VDEVLPTQTYTDADPIQVAGAGVPTGLISLPVRNLHTCAEMVHLDDLVSLTRLLVSFAGQLDDSTTTALRDAFNHD